MDFRGQDDRGQLIVVAALLLAVLFVGLALVLNSAIYAENVATRGETSTSDAMAVDTVTEERLQQSIHQANYDSDTASYAERRAVVTEAIGGWDDQAGAREATTGKKYYVRETGMTEGTRVVQNETKNFLPENEDFVQEVTDITLDPMGINERTTWIPAPDVEIRAFWMDVQRDSLAEADGDLIDQIESLGDEMLTGSDAFWVQTNRTTGEDVMYRIYLANDAENDSVAAIVTEIEDGSESLHAVCRARGDSVTVNVSDGHLKGDEGSVDCPELRDAIEPERNNVFFVGADEVNGTYQFIVDDERSTFEDRVEHANSDDGLLGSLVDSLSCLVTECEYTIYGTGPSSDMIPYTTTAIYGVSVETTYQDDRISYTRNTTYPETAR